LNNYLVLWPSGLGGRFFTWFINQHKNFCQFDLIERPDDFSPDCPMYNFSNEKYSDWLNKISKDYIRNKKANKCAFNTYPHHSLAWDDENKISLPALVEETSCKTITLWSPETLRKDFVKRILFHTMRYTTIEEAQRAMNRHVPNERYSHINDRLDIDIGKLLTKDETEYKLLLDYIEEDYLTNWNDYMDHAKSVMFRFLAYSDSHKREFTYDKI